MIEEIKFTFINDVYHGQGPDYLQMQRNILQKKPYTQKISGTTFTAAALIIIEYYYYY